MSDRRGTKMVLTELRAIAQMARKLRRHVDAGRLPTWAEYKIQRAKMELRGAVLKAAHGSEFEQAANPSDGYMAAANLAQIQEDASWLAENLDPKAVLPEWFEHLVHSAHIDIDRIYTRFVRRENPAIACGHDGCRPLPECPMWAIEMFVGDRIEEDWHAPVDGGVADGHSVRGYDPQALQEGLCVELEHTACWWKALRIAMDHLAEHPDYYVRLRQMEAALKRSVLR